MAKKETEEVKKEDKVKEEVAEKETAEETKPVSEVENEEKKEKKNRKLKWYIVKSHSSKEKSIAEQLRQRVKANDLDDKITEVIVPTQEKIVIQRGKKKTVDERIFPGYILVRMEVTPDTLHVVRNTDGVLGFIGSSSYSKKPTPLSQKEVDAVMAFMKVKQMPTYASAFIVNDPVKVTDGPFKDFVGTVQEINENKGQVTVLLSIFGRETPVQLDFLQVTKI
ncbi:MAG: transcription termination/antitermination protein NusG [Candidatus Dojkabacteria bacterium]|nr:transcription termination/antitermination protein NusG [Candidatus Dojkabacteria bacterium]MDQ7021768.1 transcription termination/antitermination protein NusG [Candidatus Dojkabacteria bacterium]